MEGLGHKATSRTDLIYKTQSHLGMKPNIEAGLTKEEIKIWRDWVIKLLSERI